MLRRMFSKARLGMTLALLTMWLCACASLASTTMTKGIRFGMSPTQVLARLEPANRLIESNDDQIVAEGVWDLDGTTRRKTFMFREGGLDCVRYDALEGQRHTPVGSTTSCR